MALTVRSPVLARRTALCARLRPRRGECRGGRPGRAVRAHAGALTRCICPRLAAAAAAGTGRRSVFPTWTLGADDGLGIGVETRGALRARTALLLSGSP